MLAGEEWEIFINLPFSRKSWTNLLSKVGLVKMWELKSLWRGLEWIPCLVAKMTKTAAEMVKKENRTVFSFIVLEYSCSSWPLFSIECFWIVGGNLIRFVWQKVLIPFFISLLDSFKWFIVELKGLHCYFLFTGRFVARDSILLSMEGLNQLTARPFMH